MDEDERRTAAIDAIRKPKFRRKRNPKFSDSDINTIRNANLNKEETKMFLFMNRMEAPWRIEEWADDFDYSLEEVEDIYMSMVYKLSSLYIDNIRWKLSSNPDGLTWEHVGDWKKVRI